MWQGPAEPPAAAGPADASGGCFPSPGNTQFSTLGPPVATGELAGSRCQGVRAAASQRKHNSVQPPPLLAREALPGISTPRYRSFAAYPSSSPACVPSDALFLRRADEVGGAVWPDSIVMDNAMQVASKTYEPPKGSAPPAAPVLCCLGPLQL